MSEQKRVNPYERLLQEVRAFALRVKSPRRKSMWIYPKAKLEDSWSMADLAQRVAAGDQLGYDTRLRLTDEGLLVEYVKRPDIPMQWL